MPNQYLNGKAFEYACLTSFYNFLSIEQEIFIENTPAFEKAQEAFYESSNTHQSTFKKAANSAIKFIIRAEPMLKYSIINCPLFLRIQEDAYGQAGDVRDILMIRRLNGWEIGLSVKHNHFAVKHSRLSKTIDFGYSWLGMNSSGSYFDDINPIFDELQSLGLKRVKWREVSNKKEKYYIPVLNAFIKELRLLNISYPNEVPPRLLSYLLGKNDFYKIIADIHNRATRIQAFSLYGKLNKSAGHIHPEITIPKLRLPQTIYAIEIRPHSQTTIQIIYDEGWTVLLRIHSASTYVEPSLKFDITLQGNPSNLYTHTEPW